MRNSMLLMAVGSLPCWSASVMYTDDGLGGLHEHVDGPAPVR